jgi:ATP-binding cassette, subfamily B, multidrug efflux pump
VLNADRIIVLDRGEVSGIGSHAELLQSNALYREIYLSQLGIAPPSDNAAIRPGRSGLAGAEA